VHYFSGPRLILHSSKIIKGTYKKEKWYKIIKSVKSRKITCEKYYIRMKWTPHIDVLTEAELSHHQVPEKSKKINIITR